jgi:dTDP-4-amino-4,6-dideoxygalactose transaminase
MAAILCDLKPGDEVIMPSYTFVSTANAVVLRGATPVFVDIRSDTLNLDERLVEAAITPRTRAIWPVHYAGVSCEMDALCDLADAMKLDIVEDAAQGFNAFYKGRPLGTIGRFGALSFHETKNVISGEGGALVANQSGDQLRAEMVREKGTNRSQFFRGQVDKYTWLEVGSSYLPSDLLAALLLAQLERAQEITAARLAIWDRYMQALSPLARAELLEVPHVPPHCQHNGHIFYIICRNLSQRTRLQTFLKTNGVASAFHYVPLHTSPAGRKFGRFDRPLQVTDSRSDCMLRLPLFSTLTQQDRVIEMVKDFFEKRK